MEFNAKKYFSNLTESSKFTFYCQNQFFAVHNLRWNDGSSRCTAKVCVIRPSRARLFNLIQVFPLLQLASVTFALLCPTHINFTCNVLMFVIRYEIMLITSSGLRVPKQTYLTSRQHCCASQCTSIYFISHYHIRFQTTCFNFQVYVHENLMLNIFRNNCEFMFRFIST